MWFIWDIGEKIILISDFKNKIKNKNHLIISYDDDVSIWKNKKIKITNSNHVQ